MEGSSSFSFNILKILYSEISYKASLGLRSLLFLTTILYYEENVMVPYGH